MRTRAAVKRVVKDILLVVFAEIVCIGVRWRWTCCGLKKVKREGAKGGLYMLKAGTRGIYNRFEITHMSLKTLHPSVVRIKSQRR